MSVQLCPTCGRRPSERIGTKAMDTVHGEDVLAGISFYTACTYPCSDPIHDFADTHAAEVARLTAERDKWKALADEGRAAGREEALQIVLREDAEEPFDDARESHPIGDTGDWGVSWSEAKLRTLFSVEPGATASVIERAEAMYWDCEARSMENDQEVARLRGALNLVMLSRWKTCNSVPGKCGCEVHKEARTALAPAARKETT